MGTIKQLKNRQQTEDIYPITTASAVYNNDNTTVEEKLQALYNSIQEEKQKHTLLLLDGNSFQDSSLHHISLTNNGVTLDTNTKMFGNSSYYFNGSSWIDINAPDMFYGLTSYTIEYWQYTSGYGGGGVFTQEMSDNVGYGPFLIGYEYNSSKVSIYMGNTTSWNIASNLSMGAGPINTWTHWAIVRNNSTYMVFKDGTLQNEWTSANHIGRSPRNIYFGKYERSSYSKGYIDSLKVSDKALYTKNFIRPSTPFTL